MTKHVLCSFGAPSHGQDAVGGYTHMHANAYTINEHTTHTYTRIPGSLNRAKRRSCNRKVVESNPGYGMSGGGRWQPCVQGILSGEITKLSRPWRPPCCREHHQM